MNDPELGEIPEILDTDSAEQKREKEKQIQAAIDAAEPQA